MADDQTNLERYDLLERIAVGGMAQVFRAKAYGAHGFEKPLAIKRILPELASNQEFEERFIAEAKLAVTLTHANLVQVFDFGRLGDELFIAMEYVDGVDLATLLESFRKRGELIPLPAAFQIAIDLFRGLDFAHQHKVIHRDVSPSNILLSAAGEVKIADFGIAVTDTEDLVKSSSNRRRIMGKWRYMSPEQTRAAPLTTRSDLFAAAAVVYEVFIGEKLFPGDEIAEIVDNIRGMNIPDASKKRPGLPAKLDELLHEVLARSADHRPRRAATIQRAITEISYESSIVASPMNVADAVAVVMQRQSDEPERSANNPRDRHKRNIDDLILGQLDPSAAERRTVADGTEHDAVAPDAGDPGYRDEPDSEASGERRASRDGHALSRRETVESSLPDEERKTATFVRTGVRADGVTMWTQDEPVAESSSIDRRRLLSVALAIALVAAVGWIGWKTGSESSAAAPQPILLADAGVPGPGPLDRIPDQGFLRIQSSPSGAQIWIDGEQLSTVTPATLVITADQSHYIELMLAGHHPGRRDGIRVETGRSAAVELALEPMPAALEIRTRPPGAQILIGDRLIGTTPRTFDALTPGSGQTVTLSKQGYSSITRVIDLPPGGRFVIDETLRKVPRRPEPVAYGSVDIHIQGSWADIYLGNKNLGRAPMKGIRLPAGTHRLRLYNPVLKKEKYLSVTVVAGKENTYYTTTL